MDRTLIETYAAGADVLTHWIHGVSTEQLDAHPIEGTWSIRELVLHMVDSDQIGSYRMKLLIAHDDPQLQLYDQDAFAAQLAYDRRDVSLACNAFRVNRLATADLLHSLPDEVFQRPGQHAEHGPLTLENLLGVYILHLEHHETFLRAKREKLGVPLESQTPVAP